VKSGPLRVCHLISGDTWGGAEAFVYRLAVAQVQTGHEVGVILLNRGLLEQRIRAAGIQHWLIPEAQYNFFGLLRCVRDTVQRFSPSVLHAHRYKEDLLAACAPHAVKVVVTLHGYEPTYRLADRLKVHLVLCCVRGLERIRPLRFVAVSEDLRRRFQFSPARCDVIPNGVELPEAGALQRSAEYDASTVTIGWVGRMVPVKALSVLIEAFALLCAREPTLAVRLLLVGEGPERPLLQELAQHLRLASRIEFAGFSEDVARAFQRMTLLALPSLHEGLPLSLLEAMAHGVPVIAAAVGGIPQALSGTGAARLVASHAPEIWCEAIRELLHDPSAAQRLASAGRKLVEERFSIRHAAQQYAALYTSSTF